MNKLETKTYFDYAATTPVDPKVVKKMLVYFSQEYGNSASLHSKGLTAKKALENSREICSRALNCKSKELVFTSSATESNNLALKGIAFAKKQGHLVISATEHDCVLNAGKWLQTQGFELDILKPDQYGMINPNNVEKAIKPNTILVSIMHANNEIGTINPVREIGEMCKKNNVLFHVDASQTFGKTLIDVQKMNIDLLTASSHKMYGPKGVGLLYVKQGTEIQPILHGGGHETGLRSSTVNVAGIVGFSKAIELCLENINENREISKFRDQIIEKVLKTIPNSYLNGHPEKRLANNAHFRFDFIEGEAIVLNLDSYGISCSTGSACSSPSLEPSHVLLSLGLRHDQAHGSLRVSLGRWTTQQDVDYFLETLPKTIKKLRDISPLKK